MQQCLSVYPVYVDPSEMDRIHKEINNFSENHDFDSMVIVFL